MDVISHQNTYSGRPVVTCNINFKQRRISDILIWYMKANSFQKGMTFWTTGDIKLKKKQNVYVTLPNM